MSDTEYRIDRDSERILWTLRQDPQSTTGELRKELDVSQNQQILHRIHTHIGPSGAGFVRKHSERMERGVTTAVWDLTHNGKLWVDENEEKIKPPKTLSEVREEAIEAKTVAKSAQSTAATTSARVNKVQRGLEQTLDDARQAVRRAEITLDNLEQEAGVVADKQIQENIDNLREELKRDVSSEVTEVVANNRAGWIEATKEIALEDLEGHLDGRVSDLEEDIDALNQSIENAGEWVESIEGHLNECASQREMIEVKSDIESLQRWQNRGFLDRLRWLVFGT